MSMRPGGTRLGEHLQVAMLPEARTAADDDGWPRGWRAGDLEVQQEVAERPGVGPHDEGQVPGEVGEPEVGELLPGG
ncbi:MAG: hypothetical protein AAB265_05530, partial [candidate division NC10 bacterium]